jgi:hypothetical protein
MKRICGYCGKEIVVKPSRIREVNFCKYECFDAYRKLHLKVVKCICEGCGKEFEKIEAEVKRTTSNFCSKKCRKGILAPNYKSGIKATYYRQFLKTNCEECGATSHLQIHHKDKNRHNNLPINLETVCRSCHNRLHGVGKWSKYKKSTSNFAKKPIQKKLVL